MNTMNTMTSKKPYVPKLAIQVKIVNNFKMDQLLTIFGIQSPNPKSINEKLCEKFNDKHFGPDFTYTLTVNKITVDKNNKKFIHFDPDMQFLNVIGRMKDCAKSEGATLLEDSLTNSTYYDYRIAVEDNVEINIGTIYYFTFKINQ